MANIINNSLMAFGSKSDLEILKDLLENKDIFGIPFGEKIEALFSDKVWNNLGSNFDKNSLHDLLNRCSELRNEYFHFRDDQIDIKLLKHTWNILKRELDG